MQQNKNKNTGTQSNYLKIGKCVIGCIHLNTLGKCVISITAREATLIYIKYEYQNTDTVGKYICKGCYNNFF